MTHFTDFIDSAIFIKENELASKVACFSDSPSGSLTALTSVFREPFLFEGVSVMNPTADLVNHLTHDIQVRKSSIIKDKQRLDQINIDTLWQEKVTEFGDISKDPQAYHRVL